VLLLARELAAMGIEQVVVTSQSSRLARDLAAASIPTREVLWRTGLSFGAIRAAWKAAGHGACLLHAHDGHSVTLAGVASVLARRPFVATRRTVFPLRRPALWKRAARVVAVSRATGKVLADGGVPEARVVVVPSGIDLEATRQASPFPIREHLGLAPETPIAVTVAAFTREKDHDTLIRAAALLRDRAPDLHWVLAGDGPMRPHVERLVRDLGLASRIHLLGWVDAPLGLIAAANVFVLTSRAEGVGTVLLDAMGRQVPVVATRVGGVPEAVADGALLADPGNPAQVAEGVLRVLGEPELRRTLMAAGTRAVARRSAGGMARAMLAVYRSVLLTR
jgi:glycosyltransferase involved in cell wall biosynthesis